MSACCDGPKPGARPAWMQKARSICAWILPNAILVLMPKCPACLAAYLALLTGFGLSFAAATYVRWALIILCVASLLFLIVKRLKRHFKKEIEPCNTK